MPTPSSPTIVTEGQLDSSVDNPGRRRLMKLGLTGMGAAALGSLSLSALADMSGMGAKTSSDDTSFSAFMTLSAWLMSDKTLDDRLGQRFFEAMSRMPIDGVPKLGALVPLKQKLLALGEARDRLTADDLDETEMALVRRILQAWMLGTVGQSMDDPQAEVIAYEMAGMYAGPRDVQIIRTYCPNRPGFWTERPY